MRFLLKTVLLLYFVSIVVAEVSVTVPVIDGANIQLRTLLENAMISAGTEVERYLDGLGDKPLLFGTMTMVQAAAFPWSGFPDDTIQVGIGTHAAGLLPSFDYDELTILFDEFEYEDDISAGVGLFPVYAHCILPLGRFITGLYGGAMVSVFAIDYERHFYRGFAAAAEFMYRPFPVIRTGAWGRWTILSLYTGLGYQKTRLGSQIEPGTFEQEFELDPDGSGPYPGETISVTAEPLFELGFSGWNIVVPLGLGTEFCFWETLGIAVGVSSAWYGGVSGFEISGGAYDVAVGGYLGAVISTPGSISVDYDYVKSRYGFVAPKGTVSLMISVGSLEIRVPIGYGIDGTVSAGIVMEAGF
ncbi:MAG: hypothetical protein JXB03_13240 [Spirochaetales bacterium]|nr:hypothetical protein [Spirochaetales bacterium]